MRLATPEDIERIHAVSHHPAVVAMTHGPGETLFDMRVYLRNPHGVLLMDGGHFAIIRHEEGVYEFHTTFLPGARGKSMFRQCEQALRFMFIETQCEVLHTHVPANNPGAEWLVKRIGFRKMFSRQKVWHARDGKVYDVDYYTLRIEDWIATGTCEKTGERFHAELHETIDVRQHDKDYAHDCFVGAAIELIKARRWDKGLKIYSRWARHAGYEVPRKVSPLRVEFTEFAMNIQPTGGFSIEVMQYA